MSSDIDPNDEAAVKKSIAEYADKTNYLSAMKLNRKDRRALGKANGHVKIPASNKPFVKPRKP